MLHFLRIVILLVVQDIRYFGEYLLKSTFTDGDLMSTAVFGKNLIQRYIFNYPLNLKSNVWDKRKLIQLLVGSMSSFPNLATLKQTVHQAVTYHDTQWIFSCILLSGTLWAVWKRINCGSLPLQLNIDAGEISSGLLKLPPPAFEPSIHQHTRPLKSELSLEVSDQPGGRNAQQRSLVQNPVIVATRPATQPNPLAQRPSRMRNLLNAATSISIRSSVARARTTSISIGAEAEGNSITDKQQNSPTSMHELDAFYPSEEEKLPEQRNLQSHRQVSISQSSQETKQLPKPSQSGDDSALMVTPIRKSNYSDVSRPPFRTFSDDDEDEDRAIANEQNEVALIPDTPFSAVSALTEDSTLQGLFQKGRSRNLMLEKAFDDNDDGDSQSDSTGYTPSEATIPSSSQQSVLFDEANASPEVIMHRSIKHPAVLVGRRIIVPGYGPGIVLSVKKKRFSTTKFAVQFENNKIVSLKLQRSKDKGNVPFQLAHKLR